MAEPADGDTQKYEYVAVTIPLLGELDDVITVQINKVAKYGWRLVGSPMYLQATRQAVCVFEREKP